MIILINYRGSQPKFTVDKAPLSVDNSIKQVDNASLQGCFEIKPRQQKPLQGDLRPKQGGFVSLQGRFRIKPGGLKLLSVGYFQKHRGLYFIAGAFCSFAGGLCCFTEVEGVLAGGQMIAKTAKREMRHTWKLFQRIPKSEAIVRGQWNR